MNKVIINREALHAALDKWLDVVAADPLTLEDGERHTFRLDGAGGQFDDQDNELVSFVIKTSKEEHLC